MSFLLNQTNDVLEEARRLMTRFVKT